MPLLDRIARCFLLTLIWLGAFLLTISMIFSSLWNDSSFEVFMITIGLFAGAIVATYIINPMAKALPAEAKRETESTAKRKNEQAGFSPFELLTPEDLEDLRAEMKDRLRQRILSDTDGEMASLDELLDEPPARAKRR